jgi:hypothetical protein
MRIFRKKKTIEKPAMQHEELAGKIAKTIIRAQTYIANYLSAKTNKLSKKGKVILFVAFSILFAAINIYILI